MQVRTQYFRAYIDTAVASSAYNLDVAYAVWRSCFEGTETWLNTVERGRQYAAGDAWGCMGRWFSGRWYTPAATDYMARVRDYLDRRVWTTPEFTGNEPSDVSVSPAAELLDVHGVRQSVVRAPAGVDHASVPFEQPFDGVPEPVCGGLDQTDVERDHRVVRVDRFVMFPEHLAFVDGFDHAVVGDADLWFAIPERPPDR